MTHRIECNKQNSRADFLNPNYERQERKKMLNSFISKFGQNPQMIYPQWNEKKEKQQEKHSNNSQHPVKRVKTRETKNAQLYKALNRQLQYPRVCSCCESKETN